MSFQTYGQNESLISSIRNIMKDYSVGSIIKEFLQNADDAGAKRFHVIIDERSHPTNNLFCENMSPWQGPAILIYNDEKFRVSDFESLMQIRVGGKQDDNTKIGKHGLGFNSCYHFTDVPSFISGDYIAFLDPQEKYLPMTRRGIIGPIPKNGIYQYPGKDQLVPFVGIEGLDFRSTFEGTLFRIPLRQQPSELTDRIFTIDKILELITNIQSNFSEQLLFLRNIETIEMSHIRGNTIPPQINSLWKATITGLDENIREQRKRINDDAFQIFQLKIQLINNLNNIQNDHWIIATGAQQNPEDLQLEQYARRYRLRVLGGIAALLKSSKNVSVHNFTGRMYSFFQLPDVTNLPIHLNGTWAQGSDRGKLLIEKDDLPDLDHEKLKWNRHILLDFLPKLYCKFLEKAINLQKSEQVEFKYNPIAMFWPFPPTTRNYPKYAIEYGCKVLQHILKNDDIFQLINDGSSNENNYTEILFKLLRPEQINELRNLLRINWGELRMKSDSNLKPMVRSLPIWPIVSDPLPNLQASNLQLLTPLASCGYFLLEDIKHYRTKNSKIYLKVNDPNDPQIFTDLNVPQRDIYSYVFEDVDFPDEFDDRYFEFLKSILELCNPRILQGLKQKSCFPTLTKKLKKITDLYDYNNYFFRNMFSENSDIFLHHDLSKYASILSGIGFKHSIDQVTFIDSALKIEELQKEVDPPSDIRYRGFFITDYLYKHIDTLGIGTLEGVMRIPFVPTFKNLDKAYSLHYERPVLDCFNNIILFKYKDVAWSQMSLIAEDVIPPQHVLQRYPSFGKPKASTVIEHLRYLYHTLRNDDEWKSNWTETFKHNVYEVYKWLNKECLDDESLSLSRYIRPIEPLFLNFNRDQDPFNIDNWVTAMDLVLNSESNEEKYVNPSLARYSTMLKSAGVREIRAPNVRINVREHDRSYIDTVFKFLLDQDFFLHDFIFIVKDEEIRASQYILAARSRFFHQRFTLNTIIVEDVEPNSMRILLRYFYGQDIDDAIQNSQRLNNGHRTYDTINQSSILALYKDLLKLADRFELDHLKELMELRLSRFINKPNAEDMKNFAGTLNANQLKNFCRSFILENGGM